MFDQDALIAYHGGYGNGGDDEGSDDGGDGANIRVSCNNDSLNFAKSEQPYYEGHTLMVPLKSTGKQLGLEVVNDINDGTIVVEGGKSTLKLARDSKKYRLNGRSGLMSTAAVERGGVIYAPIEAVASMKSDRIYVNGTKIEGLA
jgi:hypothetical protein